eukprot:gnl/TRDRNA2_/TRDRNA2_175475_c0_seq2.p2 gnl/TRDRNA2_/TRDRNA2_175475_c0~~gnl/TRDRNA2_/TRDRNA2_175475_c0_seq2.p2  ORF type:complete len:130 (+),score=10.22 gnl/TRDRNA2_/TRDRNA2_175475_c0_seq2:160-549(+)
MLVELLKCLDARKFSGISGSAVAMVSCSLMRSTRCKPQIVQMTKDQKRESQSAEFAFLHEDLQNWQNLTGISSIAQPTYIRLWHEANGFHHIVYVSCPIQEERNERSRENAFVGIACGEANLYFHYTGM